MNYLDIIIGILLIAGLIGGFFKGLVASVASLAGLVVGIWASIEYTPQAGQWLSGFIHIKELYVNIIAFFLIYGIVQVAFFFAGKLLENIIEGLALGFFNKLLGAIFGIFKTALILSFLLIILNTFWKNNNLIPENTQNNSKLYKPVATLIPKIYPGYNIFADKIKNLTTAKE